MAWRDADDERDDVEFPDAYGDNADVDGTTFPCPHCFHTVYEDAERCSGCGRYLSIEDAPARKPWWLVIGVLVCLIVVIGWIVR